MDLAHGLFFSDPQKSHTCDQTDQCDTNADMKAIDAHKQNPKAGPTGVRVNFQAVMN